MAEPAAATWKIAPDTATVVRDIRSPAGRAYSLTILFCTAEAISSGPALTTKTRSSLRYIMSPSRAAMTTGGEGGARCADAVSVAASNTVRLSRVAR
jgi:hypothetical protein